MSELTSTIRRVIGKILIECGYADDIIVGGGGSDYRVVKIYGSRDFIDIDPFACTCDGYHQTQSIEAHWRLHTMPVVEGYIIWSSMFNGEKKRFDTMDPSFARNEYLMWGFNKLLVEKNE